MAGNTIVDPLIRLKYDEERQKRFRKDGERQFIDLDNADQFSYLAEDPWVDHASLNSKEPSVQDGGSYEYLILGAGYGALLYAARLIDSGVLAKDIRMVDTAGGFGGTWYWNRYPGLMCDIESYIYMPLLEATGYMPKNRYSYGPELREHADRIAAHYDMSQNALFRSRIVKQTWNDLEKVWKVDISEYRGPQYGSRNLHIAARLDKLKNLRVGILGTGATAVQAIPKLAEYAKHLYVFQRTPASCEVRNQRDTDPTEFKKISSEKGWQRKRQENFNYFVRGEALDLDLVQDGWCQMPSYSAVLGSSRKGIIQPQDIRSHLADLESMDFPRAQRLRERVDEIVKDKNTAKDLKSWYPTYCKRPTFHDEYLQTFNKPSVQLVKTAAHGIESATNNGIIVNGVEYPVDLMIFSTGFGLGAAKGTGSPAEACGIEIVGRNGITMPDKWSARGPATLHGLTTRNFPNLFFSGIAQTGTSLTRTLIFITGNISYILDISATHVAYIIRAAREAAGGKDFSIEPTEEIEEKWASESAERSNWFASHSTCTPSYINGYGAGGVVDGKPGEKDLKETIKAARKAPWGMGSQNYMLRLESWRESGKICEDLEIQT
ncbi:FAD/NAD(P)-binding domain-containing protein [Corynespora cassiicola Philippines]|uniref:FAD/NAD(P)-binding domain-containing protein n=1 Tax=Corynespora cassiicola Philippines TaxID=1448308 RepID=A0A2T2NKW3_CORCC|nr:FAD/NAD(P)-binding domain-containing protein [Corynespora cassiicola Philippines]